MSPSLWWGGGLTVDGEGDLLLAHAHPGHHGTAHVLPCILLAHSPQGQHVAIAQHLRHQSITTGRVTNISGLSEPGTAQPLYRRGSAVRTTQ